MIKVADTSWLTPWPVNPMNIGQIINNENEKFSANVRYQEAEIPLSSFPILQRKFLPNIKYQNFNSDEAGDNMKVVYLQVIHIISIY